MTPSFPAAPVAGAALSHPAQRGVWPCCSLRARPLPQPAPPPSWEDLLGQR